MSGRRATLESLPSGSSMYESADELQNASMASGSRAPSVSGASAAAAAAYPPARPPACKAANSSGEQARVSLVPR